MSSFACSVSDSSVLQKMRLNPCSLATSSAPRARVVKNGLVISVSTRARVLVCLKRRLRASVFGT